MSKDSLKCNKAKMYKQNTILVPRVFDDPKSAGGMARQELPQALCPPTEDYKPAYMIYSSGPIHNDDTKASFPFHRHSISGLREHGFHATKSRACVHPAPVPCLLEVLGMDSLTAINGTQHREQFGLAQPHALAHTPSVTPFTVKGQCCPVTENTCLQSPKYLPHHFSESVPTPALSDALDTDTLLEYSLHSDPPCHLLDTALFLCVAAELPRQTQARNSASPPHRACASIQRD